MTRAALALLLAAVPALFAAGDDPAAPGTLAVAAREYRITQVPLPTVAYPIDIWGSVWYPEDLSRGPFPFVLLLHGNHGICRAPGTMIDLGTTTFPPFCPAGQIQTPNHAGYEYIATRLASHGYIVASMNVNAINIRANGNPERGQAVLETLRYFERWNSSEGAAPFGNLFSGKIDLQNVGLMGHSRGGEGVRAGLEFNRQAGSPFNIKGIIEIGPVDFGRSTSATAVTTGNPVYNATDTAFAVILPSCDADVSDNQGMRVFDRSRGVPESLRPTPKSQLYVLGANHNFYNSEWTPEDPGFSCIDFPIITTREQQEAIGLVYVMGFMRTYLGGEDFHFLFDGSAPQPAGITTPVAHSFNETTARNLLIDDFTSSITPDGNNAGGPNVINNLKLTRCLGAECASPPPAAWRHDPGLAAARIEWPGEESGTPYYIIHVGDNGAPRDLSSYAYLTFRAAAAFDLKNPVVGSQNFSIRLRDGADAGSNTVALTDYNTLPYPTGYGFRRSVLRTVRIPLAHFRNIDLRTLSRIEVFFDKTQQGAIFLTDVQFAQQPQRSSR